MSDPIINDELDSETNLDPEIDILSLYTGQKDVYLQNWDAVNRLGQESDLLAKGVLTSFGVSEILAILSLVNPAIAFVSWALTFAFFSNEYIWRVRRLYVVAKSILDHYGDDNVVLTPRVKTDTAAIDLLVKMPDRRMFALMTRANEDREVIWREDRQEFFIKKNGKHAKRAIALTKAIESLQTVSYLRKIKHPLMGITAAERNAPLIKAIVLAPGARIVAYEDSPLWTEFGGARVLRIQTTSVTYVVECKDLINFLQPIQKNGESTPK
jgi:hypothetical protein